MRELRHLKNTTTYRVSQNGMGEAGKKENESI